MLDEPKYFANLITPLGQAMLNLQGAGAGVLGKLSCSSNVSLLSHLRLHN